MSVWPWWMSSSWVRARASSQSAHVMASSSADLPCPLGPQRQAIWMDLMVERRRLPVTHEVPNRQSQRDHQVSISTVQPGPRCAQL